eukprot:5877739-Alexandrium_andersonii.AAC.1
METCLWEPPDGDDFVMCTGCRCEVATAYFATARDETDLSLPGDALCEAYSYALRYKRFLCETEPPDDMPEEYRKHLAQQRQDARAMEELIRANCEERGIERGKEYEGEAELGVRHPADVLKDARGPRIHQCATMKRVIRGALSIGALAGGAASSTTT